VRIFHWEVGCTEHSQYEAARDAYMRVLTHQPDHAKVLQQLGWLHHQPGAPFADQDKAVSYLTKSLETGKLFLKLVQNLLKISDGTDAQSWYLLGRAFMAGQRYNKAYEAYQQAVYRDGRNPTFWCSIGVLYYQINQYRDALDAYSRAIRLNPYISEVWYNLGSLYESCNNQVTDAIDAYTRAADLDPTNATIKQRLGMLQNAGSHNTPLPPVPGPVDVHPSQYSATPAGGYPPNGSPAVSPGAAQIPPPNDPRDAPQGGRDLPPPPEGGEFNRNHSPGPFRGGAAPPPLQHVDESRGSMSRHAPLAPMETQSPGPRDARDARDRERFRDDSQRYEQRPGDMPRRPSESSGSPRRRPDGFSGYQPYPSTLGPYPGDREGDDLEGNRDKARQGPFGSYDPRAPSPRTHDRAPHPPQDPRRQLSSRVQPDYRGDYGRPGESSYPFYGQDSRAQMPLGVDPRDRGYDRRQDERGDLKAREPTPNGNGIRPPSISREIRPDDTRATSPAASTGSRAGSKRKIERKEDEKDGQKRPKDEKPLSKRGSGDKKATKAAARGDEDVGSSRDTVASSPQGWTVSSTPLQTPQQPSKPRREVDDGALRPQCIV